MQEPGRASRFTMCCNCMEDLKGGALSAVVLSPPPTPNAPLARRHFRFTAGSRSARALFHCIYCSRDVSSSPRVKCTECKDFDLCLECFSVGVELVPHRRTHAYQVIGNLGFPIYDPTWGADEEGLLLEALDTYGLGNWAALADYLGGKSAEECKTHYFQVYIDADSFPLPTPTPEMARIPKNGNISHLVATTSASHKRQNRGAKLSIPPAGLIKLEVGDPTAPDADSLGRPTTGAAPAASAASGAALGHGGPATPSNAFGDSMELDIDATAASTSSAQLPSTPPAVGGDKTMPSGAAANTEGGLAGEAGVQGTPLADGDRGGKGLKRHRQEEAAGKAAAAASPHVMTTGSRTVHASSPGAHPQLPADPGATPLAQPSSKDTEMSAGVTMEVKLQEPDASTTTAAPGVPVAAAIDKPLHQVKAANSNTAEVTGYHAKRHEFEPEYDAEAEVPIADMEFGDTDTPEDRAQKLRMLEVYNRRLDERERRRDVVLERGLLNVKRIQAQERRRSHLEKEVFGRLRVFERYQSQDAHDEMVEGLLLESRLRTRIAELQQHRRQGLRTLTQAESAEAEKRRQRAAAEERAATGLGPLGRPERSNRQSRTLAADDSTGAGQATSGSLAARRAASNAPPPGPIPRHPSYPESAAGPAPGRPIIPTLQSWRVKRGVNLDISCMPGVELLSARERELCAAARLLPPQYLALKDLFLRDGDQHGAISRHEARTFFRLEGSRSLRIYDLLLSCSWIQSNKPQLAALTSAAAHTPRQADDGDVDMDTDAPMDAEG